MNFIKLLKRPFVLITSDLAGVFWQPSRMASCFISVGSFTAKVEGCLLIGLFALTTSSGAEELGRLFFTPSQRTQLDSDQAQGTTSEHNDHALMLNGIVQKQGGKRTIWINGVAQPASASDEKTPDSSSVPLPGQTKTIKLKVGQRVLLNPSASPNTTKPEMAKPDTPKPDAP